MQDNTAWNSTAEVGRGTVISTPGSVLLGMAWARQVNITEEKYICILQEL